MAEAVETAANDMGVTFVEDVDKDAFRAITDEIYPKFYDTIPQDLVESIRNCAY